MKLMGNTTFTSSFRELEDFLSLIWLVMLEVHMQPHTLIIKRGGGTCSEGIHCCLAFGRQLSRVINKLESHFYANRGSKQVHILILDYFVVSLSTSTSQIWHTFAKYASSFAGNK